jgi:hypothetical protein
MIRKILIGTAVILTALAGFIATRPSEFAVTRSMEMAAPAEAVFAQVNDFHKWESWSPWAKMDPAAKNTFEGPSSGIGAGFKWEGNKDVGAGGMTIVESRPSDLIQIRLEFVKPMKATNLTEFTFAPAGKQTLVTWTMSGRNNFIGKAFGLFVDCDKMIGGQFEKGLASMKAIVEAAPRK